MTDAPPPPIPNPPVRPGALPAPFGDIDFSGLEERVLAQMAVHLMPYQRDMLDQITNKQVPITEKPVCTLLDVETDGPAAAIIGHSAKLFILDEWHTIPITDLSLEVENKLKADIERRWFPLGDHEIIGTFDLTEEALAALHNMKEPVKAEAGEFRPDNRKQRRIDAAKERRKPRGKRRRLIMDIESYDPNRTKDWLR